MKFRKFVAFALIIAAARDVKACVWTIELMDDSSGKVETFQPRNARTELTLPKFGKSVYCSIGPVTTLRPKVESVSFACASPPELPDKAMIASTTAVSSNGEFTKAIMNVRVGEDAYTIQVKCQ